MEVARHVEQSVRAPVAPVTPSSVAASTPFDPGRGPFSSIPRRTNQMHSQKNEQTRDATADPAANAPVGHTARSSPGCGPTLTAAQCKRIHSGLHDVAEVAGDN